MDISKKEIRVFKILFDKFGIQKILNVLLAFTLAESIKIESFHLLLHHANSLQNSQEEIYALFSKLSSLSKKEIDLYPEEAMETHKEVTKDLHNLRLEETGKPRRQGET